MKKSLLTLLLPTLLGGSALAPSAAWAQSAGDPANTSAVNASAVNVSLDAANIPVAAALRTIFQAAGIRNFTVDAGIQGMVNASLKDVPFSLALKQVLSQAVPPAVAEVQDGVYHVHLKPRPAYSPASLQAADPSASVQSQIYKIGINHYDALVMADLITRKDGIILVPSNLVMLGNAGAAMTPGGPNVTTVGGGPFGPGAPGAFGANGPITGPQTAGPQAAPTSNNIMPDGIKRIFALQGDNSLVIETGSQNGTVPPGNPFLSPGYNPFF